MPWAAFSRAAGGRARPIVLLGLGQTVSWGSSFYLPAVLARPMAADLGLAPATVYLAFSLALVVSALIGPASGRAIDRAGGRPVLLGCNGVFALGLALLATAQGPWTLFIAWAVIGLAMGAGLYESAFATLVRLYGVAARNPITGVTLIAGFASTVGWPLSAWMLAQFGWRGACAGWAALHLLLGLPLYALLPRAAADDGNAGANRGGAGMAAPAATATAATPAPEPAPAPTPAPGGAAGTPADAGTPPASPWLAVLLSVFFAIGMFIGTAWATHLPTLLQTVGASMAVAIGVGALVGPAQVAGRVLEFGVLRRLHPLRTARAAALAHPLGIAVLLAVGGPAAAAFALLHGAGNGILTIAKGTLPLVLFGPQGYGARQGWLMLPARVAQASAPVVFGLVLDHWGRGALWLSGALGLVAFAALMAIRLRQDDRSASHADTR